MASWYLRTPPRWLCLLGFIESWSDRKVGAARCAPSLPALLLWLDEGDHERVGLQIFLRDGFNLVKRDGFELRVFSVDVGVAQVVEFIERHRHGELAEVLTRDFF